MKILLVQDEGLNIDLKRISNILNSICENVKFESYDTPVNLNSPSSYIDLKREVNILNQKTSDIKRDYTLYLTYRRYSDNYFAHSSKKTMIWSFWGGK